MHNMAYVPKEWKESEPMLQARFSDSRLVTLYHTGKEVLGCGSGRAIHDIATEEKRRHSELLPTTEVVWPVVKTAALSSAFFALASLGNLHHLNFPIGNIEIIMVFLKIVGRD